MKEHVLARQKMIKVGAEKIKLTDIYLKLNEHSSRYIREKTGCEMSWT